MTNTARSPRPCNAAALGCTCSDRAAHAAFVEASSTKLVGFDLRDGDVVFLAGRWTALNEVRRDGESMRAVTADGGEVLMSGSSTYARWTAPERTAASETIATLTDGRKLSPLDMLNLGKARRTLAQHGK